MMKGEGLNENIIKPLTLSRCGVRMILIVTLRLEQSRNKARTEEEQRVDKGWTKKVVG
jgi:hypothetical protein|tara:strand:+ start:3232 stop:3405 length:174 start_codon:yes stop_codon:yes gene_type:complete